jgi:uncharacterized protein YjbI with pentapeptide repeats
MCWLKRGRWKVSIALAGLLLFMLLMVWVPVSAGAHTGTPRLGTPEIVQSTPTVDLTVTAFAKEQLMLQVKQLQNQLQNQNNWFANNSTALIAATATVIVALFGILQWAITVRQAKDKELKDREDERRKEIATQEKELRAQAEERFKTAVTSLGDEKESVQVGGAILLCSFLKPGDEEIYGRYYAQTFDLAVAYLRPSNTSLLSEDSDVILHPSEDSHTPLPLTPLRQALIVVFREAFQLARGRAVLSLDATGIQLDRAYLVNADLRQISMSYSSLRKANLSFANLEGANLRGSRFEGADFVAAQLKDANLTVALLENANFNDAKLEETYLRGSQFRGAYFRKAFLKGARLEGSDLTRAELSGANLSGAMLSEVDLSEANLSGANLSEVDLNVIKSMNNTDLRGVKGLTNEQLVACKARGAIIDENITTSSSQSAVSSVQMSTPPPSTT